MDILRPMNAHLSTPLCVRFGRFLIKRADQADEREQIHRLNYATFVEEIQQHQPAANGRLVDKFDERNLYIIVRRGPQVVAMVAVHDQPPFSVADRLANPAVLDQLGERLLEVRLLAVRPTLRRSRVALGLLWALYRYATAANYSHLLISGVRERLALYRRFGFQSLGPAVQSGGAWFVPMAMPLASLTAPMRAVARRWEKFLGLPPLGFGGEPVSLLPGPACLSDRVRVAFASEPRSHRQEPFIRRFEQVRAILQQMTSSVNPPAVVAGNGTLANDIVAANLAAAMSGDRGLLLVNGEFGARLAAQAAKAGVAFDVLQWPWGACWDLTAVAEALRSGRFGWVWGVHCESSTGVLNPLDRLVELAGRCGVRVAADCVSSLGSVPIDLSGVDFASAASGKALGAHAGLAIVFGPRASESSHSPLLDSLDLSAAVRARGPRHTVAWGLVASLSAALADFRVPGLAAERYAAQGALGRAVRAGLRQVGAVPLAPEDVASPVITTFRPPIGAPEEFALLCRAFGYEINAWSHYLVERGLVQIATMGELQPQQIGGLFDNLQAWMTQLSGASAA